MKTVNHTPGQACPRRNRVTGAFSVEFALMLLVYLTIMFGVIEVARAIYLFNTLHDVTRRAASAAAITNFRDEPAKDKIRQNAIFRSTPGKLLLGDPVTDEHIRIDYMALVRNAGGATLTPIATGALPSCTARNRIVCMTDPNAASCIRFVRVQVCEPGNTGQCDPVRYRTIVSLIDLALDLPQATTIFPVETLGFVIGGPPCP